MYLDRNIENLHIFDDSVGHYSNLSFEIYERLQPGLHKIVNLSNTKQPQLQDIEFLKGKDRLFEILEEENVKRVFFHYLSFRSSRLLQKIKKRYSDKKMIWVFWSGDFYGLPERYRELHTPESLPYIRHRSIRKILSSLLKPFASILIGRDIYSYGSLIDSYQYIDYLCTTFKEDYNNVIQETGANNIKWLPYSYVSIERILKSLPSTYHSYSTAGTMIMIGHSSSPSNNHIEILNKISKWNNNNEVYLPLSYGDMVYKKAIKELVKQKFVSRSILVQEDLLPLDEYYKRLTKVGYAIINTKIQRGFGNIVVMLWLGVKVFLREESAMFVDFKRKGIHIFSIQSDLSESAMIPLSKEERNLNREVLREMFSSEIVEKQLLSVFNI